MTSKPTNSHTNKAPPQPTLDDDITRAVTSRRAQLDQIIFQTSEGAVTAVHGPSIIANLPGAAIGEIASIRLHDGPQKGPKLLAQVIALSGSSATLAPLNALSGLTVGARVHRIAPLLSIKAGEHLLGRVLDGFGQAIDDLGPITHGEWWPIDRPAPHPLQRYKTSAPLVTGIRAIDALLTLGEGQRIGIFAPAGTGKSLLLSHIANGLLTESNRVDVLVLGLIGERGREVRIWLEEHLPEDILQNAVVVVSTGDQPAQQRVNCALVATSIAEYFRDKCGARVLLMVDSLTRLARAHRDIALLSGELPVRQGYPASLLGFLAKLIERTGMGEHGTSITALYTVLTQAAQVAAEDPIADEVAGLLDGHFILSSAYATSGHWPALDIPLSLSRLASSVITEEHRTAAAALRKLISAYQKNQEMIAIAGHRPGLNPTLDDALERWPEIERFLQQPPTELSTWEKTMEKLDELCD